MAMLSSLAISLIAPNSSWLLRPVLPICSVGTPHSGAMRGNSTNSSTITGRPSAVVLAARRAAMAMLGTPVGICASTTAARSPHSDSSAPAAVSSDCEYRNCVSTRKKPRKNTTKASRRARSSSVLSAISTVSSVMPASRPISVRKVSQVSTAYTSAMASKAQRLGSGRWRQAMWARQASTRPVRPVAHSGRWLACGAMTAVMTANRKKLSRASRGRRLHQRCRPFMR
jgi:hypothetical protein